jgi:SAM-dependent methyltransferase
MPLQPEADRSQSKSYYESFSLEAGKRDWLGPNRRHAYLQVLVRDVLGDVNGLQLLDVGCGGGVMSSYLTRFGTVTGTDFSAAAIAAAQRIAPEVAFIAGTLDDLPAGKRYDAVLLFDVLEHIPAADRPGFLSQLAGLLSDRGVLFMSTPYPAFTARRRARDDQTLQIIDEVVEISDVLPEATSAGLQLVRYQAFDVFKGSPEYQLFVFRHAGQSDGGPAVLTDDRVSLPNRRIWRIRNAARSLRNGQRSVARWFLTGTPPDVKS